ncbi:MAG: hypothetical protein MUD13_03475 [Candidatus Nanopelagicales bacterium]|nr:hypothetical protein [Candidatus Nanopelagicales bacterium]
MSASRPTGRDPQRSRASRRSRSRGTAGTPTVAAPEALSTGGGTTTALLDPPPAPQQEPLAGHEDAQPRRAHRARLRRPRAPRHRLLLACTGVLALGLLGVLLLNTIISQGAFRQHELEVALILISEEEEALARAVQQAEAPIEVERRARELGMVPAAAPVFLRLSDGAILGEPVPAPAATGPVDFTDAPGLLPPGDPEAADADPTDPTSQGAADAGPVGEDLIDPALDPATGLDEASTPTPSATPSQPSDAATPGPAPSAGQRSAAATTTPGATP